MNSELDTAPTWKLALLVLTSFPFLLAARVLWQAYPGTSMCLLFWVMALADEPLRWSEMRQRRRWLYGLTVLGGLGNAAATIANGGYMPVLGKTEATSLWVPLTDASRLRWLCDIYAGASLGDIFIGLGLLGLLLNWICEKNGLFVPEPTIVGKRLPGLGIG